MPGVIASDTINDREELRQMDVTKLRAMLGVPQNIAD